MNFLEIEAKHSQNLIDFFAERAIRYYASEIVKYLAIDNWHRAEKLKRPSVYTFNENICIYCVIIFWWVDEIILLIHYNNLCYVLLIYQNEEHVLVCMCTKKKFCSSLSKMHFITIWLGVVFENHCTRFHGKEITNLINVYNILSTVVCCGSFRFFD